MMEQGIGDITFYRAKGWKRRILLRTMTGSFFMLMKESIGDAKENKEEIIK